MKDDAGISVFLGLAFLLLYLFIGKGAKKKTEREEVVLPPLAAQEKKQEPVKIRKIERKLSVENAEEVNLASSAYDIIKKRKSSVLKSGWNNKSSIKQAFILSEVLKKFDER